MNLSKYSTAAAEAAAIAMSKAFVLKFESSLLVLNSDSDEMQSTRDDSNIYMSPFHYQVGQNHGNSVVSSTSTAETAYLNPSTGRPFNSKDVSF